MPPITLHMVLARDIAGALQQEALDANPGAYALGASTPDIRVITRQDRSSTHFFDLDGPDHQDSVAGFFAQHGQFVEPDRLSPETRAWVCGYLTHLVLDEQYITGIYRRFFARHDALGGKVRANVMDRLLQFELERSHTADPEVKRGLCDALACTVESIDAGFIDGETLERWRKVSLDMAERSMDWDRMRGMISNHLRFAGVEEERELRTFLDSLPDLLDETIGHITSDEVDGFVRRAVDAASGTIERYLGCG